MFNDEEMLNFQVEFYQMKFELKISEVSSLMLLKIMCNYGMAEVTGSKNAGTDFPRFKSFPY